MFVCRCFWEEGPHVVLCWSRNSSRGSPHLWLPPKTSIGGCDQDSETPILSFVPSEPALRHHRKCSLTSEVTLFINVSMKKTCQMHFRESVIWAWGAAKQSVDTNFIHAAPGFPMLLRNAHSFAVGLCKCSEENTRGLHCLTELLRIKHQRSWSVEISSGDEREWQMRAKEGPQWTGE